MISSTVDIDDLHVPLDCINGGQKALTVESVSIELIRWLVRGRDDHHTLLEHHLEQAPQNDRITDVGNEQLVKTQHPHLFAQLFCQCLQGVRRAVELEQTNVYPAHEMVEMLPSCWHL